MGESIAEDGNARLSFLAYLKAVRARACALAAANALEQKTKYSGPQGGAKGKAAVESR